jgi:hypothetical protein
MSGVLKPENGTMPEFYWEKRFPGKIRYPFISLGVICLILPVICS